MKEMSKARVLAKKSVNSVLNERKLLGSIKHTFIVNIQYAFQDRDSLYLTMDLLTGGDLRYHLGKVKRFSEEQTRFFVACIVAGLEFLHNNGILHRDIKPENLVLEESGYVRITDFGIARLWTPENAKDTSGTPGYMAPEVMCRQNHGVAVDYFALGVIAYEFMTGHRPYQGKSRKEIRDLVLARQVQLTRAEVPQGWSFEAADFINKLIQRKPLNRLGLNGPQEIKAHPWLQSFPWSKLYAKELPAPFLPSRTEDNFDARLHLNNDPWKDAESEAMQQGLALLRQLETQNLFAGYFYDVDQKQSVSSSLSTV
jgi:serine/threonine protein kinase